MEYNKDNTRRRPSEVSEAHIESEWDRIFGTKESNQKKRDDYDHMFYKDKVDPTDK